MLAGEIAPAELADLAKRRAERRYRWPVAGLERLAAVAPGTGAGTLEVVAGFAPDPLGFVRVRLAITGRLVLECQRCLGPMEWPVDLTADLTVVQDDTQAGRLSEPIDAVAMTPKGLPLAVLAEDEVLAALPLAPTHAENDGCAATRDAPAASGGPNRPFAGLASLRKREAPSGGD